MRKINKINSIVLILTIGVFLCKEGYALRVPIRKNTDKNMLNVINFLEIANNEERKQNWLTMAMVLSMAKTIYERLEEKIEKAVLVGPYKNTLNKNTLTYLESSHPIPSNKSLIAAKCLKETMESLEEDDFFIYLLSGGSSALVELPVEEISMEEFQETTDLMLKGSMPIEAMNCIRKHLSQVKAGRLVSKCKARGIVLVLSDVISNDLEAIGSAPLYCDSTNFWKFI